LFVLALIVFPSTRAAAQAVSVTTAGDALQIRAPGFTFLKGEPLARLTDGRSVRVELALMVLPGPGRAPVASARQLFALSYDLWEERFAVATLESRSRSISHLTAGAAVSWCLEQVTVPFRALGAIAADAPFFIRLEYRILDSEGAASGDDGSAFTLQALIDALSRRRRTESSTDALEAGPFRLPRRGGSRARRDEPTS
jgi:hypothetical protein